MEERLQNVLSHAGEGTLWTDLKGASLAVLPAKGGK